MKFRTLNLLMAITAASLLGGCANIPVERTYAASYDADAQSGSVSITLRPVSPPRANEGPSIVNVMNDQVIAQIVKVIEAEMAKNRPAEPSFTREVSEIPARTLSDK